jgi:hypothetical protein
LIIGFRIARLVKATPIPYRFRDVRWGCKIAIFPSSQSTTFELVLNLPATRQIRLKFPQSPLARTDEALE